MSKDTQLVGRINEFALNSKNNIAIAKWRSYISTIHFENILYHWTEKALYFFAQIARFLVFLCNQTE